MVLLTIPILIFSLLLIIHELPSTIVYGWIIDDVTVLTYLGRYKKFTRNSLDESILIGEIDWLDEERVNKKMDELDYISHTKSALLSKYHIAGVGRVWRWSRGSKKIDELYRTSEIK